MYCKFRKKIQNIKFRSWVLWWLVGGDLQNSLIWDYLWRIAF